MLRPIFFALMAVVVLSGCATSYQDRKIYLWAWERNEDLTFLDTSHFGIAFLAGTCDVDTGAVLWTPRRQPLRIPPGTQTLPVIRIQSTLDSSIDRVNVLGVANSIARHAKNARMIQLDFDATVSQRKWYATLIDSLRSLLPERTKLSITALASWCIGDPWIDKLPIDEAVPMLFDMGVDDENIMRYLSQGGEITSQKAQRVFGLALDEQMPVDVKNSRLYLFSPGPWTQQDLDRFLQHYDLQKK